MPDFKIRNDTPSILNVGLWLAGVLDHHRNGLQPGEIWTPHLASLPYTFEFRKDEGSNRFSPADTGEAFGKIAAAWGAGTSSVLMGAAWGLGILGVAGGRGRAVSAAMTRPAFTAISDTMQTAGRLGAEYYHGEAQGCILTVKGVVIPLWETREYVLRREGGKVQLWDVDFQRVRGERQDELHDAPMVFQTA